MKQKFKKILSKLQVVKPFFTKLNNMVEKHPLIFCAILSLIENFVIEALGRRSLWQAIVHITKSPHIFLYNSVIILFCLSFCLLFRRRVFGIVMLSLPWLLCGIINNAVLSYRVTPLGAIDFQVAKMSLILVYLSPVQRILIYVTAAVSVIAMVALWIFGPKISGKMNFGRNVASILGLMIAVIVMTNVGLSADFLGNRFGDLVGAYNNYGFVYCFSSSVLDTGIDKPSGYSKEMVDEVVNQLPEVSVPSEDEVKPDIIMIQLESFLDPNLIKGAKFNTNPTPVFTSLKENYTCGALHMPSYGGGTANSEFEVLTGMTLDAFGAGEYPYKTILQKVPCESLAFNLKELGYGTHAIHNHTGNFYDRDKVYPNLGFDSFQSIEYMNNIERTSYGWCKDKILTNEILTAIDTDTEHESKFVWTVSVQGHGKYPEEPIADLPLEITMERGTFSDRRTSMIEYYTNMVYEMDTFIGDLISKLEERGRPTVLVMYGDHLPSLEFTDDELVLGDTYSTEYVIWDNIGLPKQPYTKMESNFLSSYVTSILGYDLGIINRYNQNCGNNEDYEEKLELLQYDSLYGEKYSWPTPDYYTATDMRMGTVPVTLDYITLVGSNLYVHGSGFTDKSKIYLNGEKMPTNKLSSSCLILRDAQLKKGDTICVGQPSSKLEVLSYTDNVIYGAQINPANNGGEDEDAEESTEETTEDDADTAPE